MTAVVTHDFVGIEVRHGPFAVRLKPLSDGKAGNAYQYLVNGRQRIGSIRYAIEQTVGASSPYPRWHLWVGGHLAIALFVVREFGAWDTDETILAQGRSIEECLANLEQALAGRPA